MRKYFRSVLVLFLRQFPVFFFGGAALGFVVYRFTQIPPFASVVFLSSALVIISVKVIIFDVFPKIADYIEQTN